MPRQDPERNARFTKFRAARPKLTTADIATYLDRSTKTVSMWTVGYPGSVPIDTMRLLELAFPVEEPKDAEPDLIG